MSIKKYGMFFGYVIQGNNFNSTYRLRDFLLNRNGHKSFKKQNYASLSTNLTL